MLETSVLAEIAHKEGEAIELFFRYLENLNHKTQKTTAIITSPAPMASKRIESLQYIYKVADSTTLASAFNLRSKITAQHKEVIDVHDPILTSTQHGPTIFYPIDDSIGALGKYILPWIHMLSSYIEAKPKYLSEVIQNWIHVCQSSLTELDFSLLKTPLFQFQKLKPYLFKLQMEQVGRHAIVKNWMIRGPKVVSLWLEMMEKLSHQTSVFLFSNQPIQDLPIASVISTLTALDKEELETLSKQCTQVDLHASGSLSEWEGSFDLICRRNHFQEYEYRLILDTKEEVSKAVLEKLETTISS